MFQDFTSQEVITDYIALIEVGRKKLVGVKAA
jgi:hypothetical protein